MHQRRRRVPQRVVQELQGVFSVMVVGKDETVEQRLVQPAERRGSLWVIPSGLKPAERIVVDGLQKIRPGVKVSAKVVLIEEEKDGTGKGVQAEPGDESPGASATAAKGEPQAE